MVSATGSVKNLTTFCLAFLAPTVLSMNPYSVRPGMAALVSVQRRRQQPTHTCLNRHLRKTLHHRPAQQRPRLRELTAERGGKWNRIGVADYALAVTSNSTACSHLSDNDEPQRCECCLAVVGKQPRCCLAYLTSCTLLSPLRSVTSNRTAQARIPAAPRAAAAAEGRRPARHRGPGGPAAGAGGGTIAARAARGRPAKGGAARSYP